MGKAHAFRLTNVTDSSQRKYGEDRWLLACRDTVPAWSREWVAARGPACPLALCPASEYLRRADQGRNFHGRFHGYLVRCRPVR
jgi:hypothetical protein